MLSITNILQYYYRHTLLHSHSYTPTDSISMNIPITISMSID